MLYTVPVLLFFTHTLVHSNKVKRIPALFQYSKKTVMKRYTKFATSLNTTKSYVA